MERIIGPTFLFLFLSCSSLHKENKSGAIARVGEEYLYSSDIAEIIPENVLAEDSTVIVNDFVKNWIEERLVLQKAELNLNDDSKNFKKQLEDYKRSLLIYEYEKKLVQEKLDTTISDQEIESLYEDARVTFRLKNNIVKARYIMVGKKSPKIKEIRKIYASEKEEDTKLLKELCNHYSVKHQINSDKWIFFDDLLEEVPFVVSNENDFLRNNTRVEMTDSLLHYFVFFKDYELKGEHSPLSFVKENIKHIIINKRKRELLTRIRKDLYQQALIKNEIEIYEANGIGN